MLNSRANMVVPSSKSRVVRFGVFEANFAAQELRKRGIRVRLRGQSFALLQMLVDRGGEIVTREEMRRALWPEDTFVDFENGLNAAIRKLRAVLGDSPESPRYIETVPKSGYRFVAPLRDTTQEPVSPAAASVKEPTFLEPSPPTQPLKHHRLRPLFGGGIVVAASLFAGVWFAARPPAAPRVLGGTKLTNTARADSYGRLQTDGARLFYLERHGHRWTLMQIPASGGEAQPFANPFQNTRLLAVSPNAAEMIIAPFKQRDEPLALWLMPSVGGAPRRLGEVFAEDAVFTSDGSGITYSTAQGVFQVGRDGLNAKPLVKMEGTILGLGWSPDGSRLRFEVRNFQETGSAIWEVYSDGSHLRPLLPEWGTRSWQVNGRWTADGRYYFFTGARSPAEMTIWVKREGADILGSERPPVPLTGGPIGMDQALPNRDRTRLFTLGVAEKFEYAKYDEARGAQALLGGVGASWATFSVDGSWLAYTVQEALWRCKPDGSDKKELVPASLNPGIASISPDNTLVAFQGHPQGQSVYRIYVVPSEGGAPRELVSEPFSASAPVWSGSASDLAITFSQEGQDGNLAALYRVNLASGAKEKLPESSGFWKIKWSPDGRYLAAVGYDLKRLAVFDAKTQKWHALAQGNIIGPVAWAPHGSTIVYQDLGEQDQPVRKLRIVEGKQAGSPERVEACKALLEGGVLRCGFEGVAPDGGLVLRLTRGDRDIYSLEVSLP